MSCFWEGPNLVSYTRKERAGLREVRQRHQLTRNPRAVCCRFFGGTQKNRFAARVLPFLPGAVLQTPKMKLDVMWYPTVSFVLPLQESVSFGSRNPSVVSFSPHRLVLVKDRGGGNMFSLFFPPSFPLCDVFSFSLTHAGVEMCALVFFPS